MSVMVSHKAFSKALLHEMGDMTADELAWVLDCKPATVKRWLSASGYPGRDNALKLIAVWRETKVDRLLNRLAGSEVAFGRSVQGSGKTTAVSRERATVNAAGRKLWRAA